MSQSQDPSAPQSGPTAQPAKSTAAKLLLFYQLADRMSQVYGYEASRLQPVDECMHSPELYQLAVDVTLRPLHLDKELLNVFCEPDAAALLMRLPNRFWFWQAVKGAVMDVGDEGLNTLLTQENVAFALAAIRRDVTMKYNLRLQLAELNPAQVASRTVAGIILVKACFGELDQISFNPIFAPCPGTDGTFAESAAALAAALMKD